VIAKGEIENEVLKVEGGQMPCPFCGEIPEFLILEDRKIVCINCGARGPIGDLAEWNIRKVEDRRLIPT
jgi:translation initiation factor 2 beta subunit (eIF-2beta)/eIF-5